MIKIKTLIKEALQDNKFNVPVKISPIQQKTIKHNVKEDIKLLIKLLEKQGFKYLGKTPGSYPHYYWIYQKKKYPTGYYRLTGDYNLSGNGPHSIGVEEFNLTDW